MEKFEYRENVILDVLLNILGTFLYAMGIFCFASPHNIAPGGASGIAIIFNGRCLNAYPHQTTLTASP